MFDFEFYNFVFKNRFKSFAEAKKHYDSVSRFSNVNPCREFDAEFYMKAHDDIYKSGLSPLDHFILHGKSEGRLHRPANNQWNPREIILDYNSKKMITVQPRIAIHLHIFYLDFVKVFSEKLKNFPLVYDLFITCTDDSVLNECGKVFKRDQKINKIKIKKTPNRGRNLGPLLVEFGHEICGYDLFCHLHSKKSLYSGREQTAWANYLIEYLIGDSTVVWNIIKIFDAYKNYGVYFPVTFWSLPCWANHWLKNKPFAAKLFEKIGEFSINKDFFPYPAGSMFWARPKAIEDILKKKWVYDDFPIEPLPNDGSTLHALERSISLVSKKNKFQSFYYYSKNNCFTEDYFYIYLSYMKNQNELLADISLHNKISFDLFDTIARRKYFFPDYAKLCLGNELLSEGLVNSAHEFVILRNNTEYELRRSKNFLGDVNLKEIYDFLGTLDKRFINLAEKLSKQEFLHDLSMIEPKHEMVNIFNHLSKSREISLITDSYYSMSQIKLILNKIGASLPNKVFISCETRKRKDNATVWPEVLNDLRLDSGSKLLHIGDNVVSDAQLAGDNGIQTLHVLNPLDKWHCFFDDELSGSDLPPEDDILKFGPLISKFGRMPLLDFKL